MIRPPHRLLCEKELREIKYQSTDDWLAAGNKITVLKPHMPKYVTCTTIKSKSKDKIKGLSK